MASFLSGPGGSLRAIDRSLIKALNSSLLMNSELECLKVRLEKHDSFFADANDGISFFIASSFTCFHVFFDGPDDSVVPTWTTNRHFVIPRERDEWLDFTLDANVIVHSIHSGQ